MKPMMTKPERSILTVEDTRCRLDKVLITRIDPALWERVETTIRQTPALSGVSRSEFGMQASQSADSRL